MTRFSTAVSALQSSQRALEVIGNNIANANTPGYTRQVTRLGNAAPFQLGNLSIGRGVQVLEIARVISHSIEAALTRQTASSGSADALLRGLTRIESRVAIEEGSAGALLERLFNELEQLSARLEDPTVRKVTVNAAVALTGELNSLGLELNRMQSDLRADINEAVREINTFSRRVAELNEQIRRTENRGANANDLRDQRDRLINDVAERIRVRVVEQDGQATVFAEGIPLVIGNRPLEIEASFDPAGRAVVRLVETGETMAVTGGKLQALLDLRNDVLPDVQGRVNEFAREVIRQFDAVHTTGLGAAGAFRQLQGVRGVRDVAAPLAEAGLAFPPRAGSLFIAVNETATGTRTVTEIAVDPASQSLQDLAAAVTAVAGVQALANNQTGTLTVLAAQGFTFDFTGGFMPDTAGFGGSAVPTVGGVFTGTGNDEFTFTVDNTTGAAAPLEVGVTPGLRLTVRDQTNNVVATLNVGEGYEAGSALAVTQGMTVRLSSGEVNDGESFSARAIGDPDTAGLLAALGLNTFFAGSDALSIRVNPDLQANPDRLATSRTGLPGDGANLQDLVALRDGLTLAGGTQSFRGFFNGLVADVGNRTQEVIQLQETNRLLGDRLLREREGLSGVDPNEELVDMIRFQRQFEIAARYVASVNATFDSLLQIV